MRPSPAAPPPRYVVLDGLRGVAALCVVACHIPPLLGRATPNAELAVDFFFCLSGFVIEHAYGERLRGGIGIGRFARARAVRLLPLYLLGTVVGLIGALGGLRFAGNMLPTAAVLEAFALGCVGLPSLFLPTLYALNGPAWSLACEAVANAAYAACPCAWRSPRLLAAVALASLVAVVALALHEGGADFGWRRDWTALGGLARVGYSFAVGVLLRRCGAVQRVPAVSPWLLALTLLTCLAMPDLGPARVWYELTFIALLSPAIVLLGSAVEVGGATRALFALSGTISYPLYVLHYPLYELAYVGAARRFGVDLAAFAPWGGLAFAAAVVALAWAVDRYLDRSVRRLLGQPRPTRGPADAYAPSRIASIAPVTCAMSAMPSTRRTRPRAS